MLNLNFFKLFLLPVFSISGGGGGGDGGAGERRRQEEERQLNVKNATGRIDSTFNKFKGSNWVDGKYAGSEGVWNPGTSEKRELIQRGRPGGSHDQWKITPATAGYFTPGATPEGGQNYFDMIRDQYAANYNPQLDDQFNKAKESLVHLFANRGTHGSSAANRKYGELNERMNKERINISDRAIGAGSTAKSDLERSRGRLISLAEGGAGVENVAAQAASEATSLSAPRNYDTLANVFADFTGNAANAKWQEQNGYKGWDGRASSLFGGSSKNNKSVTKV